METKGDISHFMLVMIVFVIVLAVVIIFLVTSGKDIGTSLKCAIGLYQFTGCEGLPK